MITNNFIILLFRDLIFELFGTIKKYLRIIKIIYSII